MSQEPGVQSVRVALVLCDRFAELIKGPSVVTAAKEHGVLFGVSGNEDELSLRIGEVQQIYPEIWRHLDDARKAFAARGADVSAYDQIRKQEGVSIGANVDVTHQAFADGDVTTKSANFNRDGHARAKKACDALMRARPDIDWAGIAKAEAEDPAIKAFGAATRRKRIIQFGLLGLLLASPLLWAGNQCRKKHAKIDAQHEAYREAQKLTPAEVNGIKASLEEEKQAIATARAGWPAVVAPAALAALVPGTEPCSYDFSAPTVQAADSFIRHGSIDRHYFGTDNYEMYSAGSPVPDSALAQKQTRVEALLEQLADGKLQRDDVHRGGWSSHIAFVVIDKRIAPIVTKTGADFAYIPGQMAGWGYIYSIANKRIVCAGPVEARNAPGDVKLQYVEVQGGEQAAQGVLMRDMDVQIRRAIARLPAVQ